MIKIKLTNPTKGRNRACWQQFGMTHHLFQQIGIQFVTDGSYDYLFVGTEEILNKRIPFKDSIQMGLDNLSKIEGPYYLFDSSDSTSLMAAYEVLKGSNAEALFKNQLLSKEDYKEKTSFNKWFFGKGSELDLGYDISEEEYAKLKLTGYNLGYHNPDYLNFDRSNLLKDIDVCAIYQGNHIKNYDHGVRNDLLYTSHRVQAWEVLKNIKCNYVTQKRPYNEYIDVLRRSKMTLSPYGMGEICFRDFEIIQFGSIMIKPDMSKIITQPNIYIPMETYIPVKYDWSDLEEKIQYVLDNYNECKDIALNAQEVFKKEYTLENLITHWYNNILSFKGITV